MTTEFRINIGKQLILFVMVSLGAFLNGILALSYWNVWYASGILVCVTVGLLGVAGVLAWTLITRPVMLRVSEDGIYIHRLNALLPWEAIAAVRPFAFRGNRMVEIEEIADAHPAFRAPAIESGADMNHALGLPPVLIDFSRTDGNVDAFLGAVAAVGPGPGALIGPPVDDQSTAPT